MGVGTVKQSKMTHQQTRLEKVLGFEKYENDEEKEDAWKVRKVRLAIR